MKVGFCACTITFQTLYIICGSFWLYHIPLHYPINGTIFGGKKIEYKCVLRFPLQLVCEAFSF